MDQWNDALDLARAALDRLASLPDELARSPLLARGQVWCRSCNATRLVDPATCLRSGWPKCCGATMTIDPPEDRA